MRSISRAPSSRLIEAVVMRRPALAAAQLVRLERETSGRASVVMNSAPELRGGCCACEFGFHGLRF